VPTSAVFDVVIGSPGAIQGPQCPSTVFSLDDHVTEPLRPRGRSLRAIILLNPRARRRRHPCTSVLRIARTAFFGGTKPHAGGAASGPYASSSRAARRN